MKNSIRIQNPSAAVKLTREQAHNLGLDITQDQIRGEMTTQGPWSIITSYKAQAVKTTYNRTKAYTEIEEIEFFGPRSLTDIRQAGYHLEGRTSIKGKKYSSFTSDILVDVEGHLINIATINVRKP